MSKFWYNMMFVNRMITFFTSRYRPQFWSGILLVFYYTSHYKRSAFLGGGRRVVHWIVTDFSCRRDDSRPAQDARSRSSATPGGQRENSHSLNWLIQCHWRNPSGTQGCPVIEQQSFWLQPQHPRPNQDPTPHRALPYTKHRTGPHSTHSVCSRLADRHFISNKLD